MRRPVIAGNWKMYKTQGEAEAFVKELIPLVENMEPEIVICPPYIGLPAAIAAARGTGIKVGAQNMFWENEGAYTGEVSPGMLKDLGCQYVIIGHSERRQYFCETDENVNKKVKAALAYELCPIVCVGETLEERESSRTFQVIDGQLEGGLTGLTSQDAAKIIIAYEPIWAIGTGKTATPEDAEEVIGHIREVLASLFGENVSQDICIQYGGSVKPENIKELMAQPNIDGALVGGASLKAESFSKIIGY